MAGGVIVKPLVRLSQLLKTPNSSGAFDMTFSLVVPKTAHYLFLMRVNPTSNGNVQFKFGTNNIFVNNSLIANQYAYAYDVVSLTAGNSFVISSTSNTTATIGQVVIWAIPLDY